MFVEVSSDELDRLAEHYNLNPVAKKIVESFVNLDEQEMDSVLKFISEIGSIAHQEIAVAKDEEDDIDKELEAYCLELEAEKKAATLSVSEDTERNIG